MVSVTDGVGNF